MRIGQVTAVPSTPRPPMRSVPITAPAVAATTVVTDVATTPADLEAMGAAFRSVPTRAEWIGPVVGRYDLEIRSPFGIDRQSGTAKVHHARVGAEEWALVPFFNPTGTGFMHQPSVLHRVGGTWQVVTDDPAPGELHEHLPEALLDHWGIVDGMPPADSVTDDRWPE